MAIEESKPFVGDIEVDESYFGPRRVRGKRGRGASGKIPVLGLDKRQGRVFLSVVKNCSKAELMPILQGRIVEGSDVYTDGWKAYDGLVTNGYLNCKRVHEGAHLPFCFFIRRAPPLAGDHFDIVQKRSIWTDADHPAICKDRLISPSISLEFDSKGSPLGEIAAMKNELQ